MTKITNKNNKRDHEMLFAQTIGILAVVNSHFIPFQTSLSAFYPYFSWHMPFFIFISGILFSRTAFTRDIFEYALHKIKSLLLPALFVNFCYGIISFFMRHYRFLSYGEDISFYNLFISPFISNMQFSNSISLWFIFQLFLIEITANFLYRISLGRTQIKYDLFLLTGTFCLSLISLHRSFMPHNNSGFLLLIHRTGFLFFFFIFGIIYDRYIKIHLKNGKRSEIICIISLLCQVNVMIITNWNNIYYVHSMQRLSLSNCFLPYFSFLTASSFILCLSHLLSPISEKSIILNFIGPNLRYVVYHHQFCGIFMGFIAFLFHLNGKGYLFSNFNPIEYKKNFWYTFAFSNNEWGKIPFLIIPFITPIIIAKIINKNNNKYLRTLFWIFLFCIVILSFIISGRLFQNELRLL